MRPALVALALPRVPRAVRLAWRVGTWPARFVLSGAWVPSGPATTKPGNRAGCDEKREATHALVARHEVELLSQPLRLSRALRIVVIGEDDTLALEIDDAIFTHP